MQLAKRLYSAGASIIRPGYIQAVLGRNADGGAASSETEGSAGMCSNQYQGKVIAMHPCTIWVLVFALLLWTFYM